MGENICKEATDKGLISKIHKRLTQLTIKKANNRIKKSVDDLSRHLSKDIEMAQKAHVKMFNITIREMQIKIIMSYHFTLVRMAIIKKSTNNKF